MTLIFRGTHTDPRFNEQVDHGRLTQNPWWPHGITYIFRDMPTEFAPMQVNDTHIPWYTHTDPRLNDRVNLISQGSVKLP